MDSMIKSIRYIILTAVILIVSGCATLYNPATGKNEIILIDSQTEISLGKNVAAELTKTHSLETDKNTVDRAQRIGARLSAVTDRKDLDYKFYVLTDKELNSVSLPGGFIYVNRGLMDALNDDELAFVLGHELGHEAARHIVKKLQANMAYQLLIDIAFARTTNTQALSQSVNMVYNLVELGYSREDEYEADRLGAKYAFKGGFNPNASLSALEKLKRYETAEPKVFVYLRTHPYVDDRISALKKVIPALTG